MKKNGIKETRDKGRFPSGNKTDDKSSEAGLLNAKIARSNARAKTGTISNSSQRKSLLLVALLFLIFLCLLVVVIYKMPDNMLTPAKSEETAELADFDLLISFSRNEGSRYYPFGDHLVYLSQDKLELLNLNNEILFDQTLEFTRPVGVYNADYFVAADRDSGKVIVLNRDNKQFELQLEGNFAGASFAGNKYISVIEENPNQPAFVHIVSLETGKISLTIQFFESGYPLAVCFSKDLTYFDVLLSNTAGSSLQPVVNRYDLAGRQTGQIMPQGYPYLYGSIQHDQADNVLIAAASHILALNFEREEPLAEHSAGKIYQLVSDQQVSALSSNRVEGEISVVDWDSANGTFIDREVNLLNQIEQVTANQDLVAISHNNQLQLYNRKSHKIVLDQFLDSNILRIGILSDRLLLITENGVKTLGF